MTRNLQLGLSSVVALFAALPAFAQSTPGAGSVSRPRPPYTVEFKTTHQQTLGNGTTINTETTEETARDSEMRRMNSVTQTPRGDRPAVTTVHVTDPNTGDQTSWNSTEKLARVIRYPAAADRHGCWSTPSGHYSASFGGAGVTGPLQLPRSPGAAPQPLNSTLAAPDSAPAVLADGSVSGSVEVAAPPVPVGAMRMLGQKPSSHNIVREDLGADTIMGVEVRGDRTTVTTPAGQVGNDQPLVRTTEMWMAPSLGLVLRSITDDPRMGKTDREAVRVDLSDPDPSIFQPPADYRVETEELQPVPCQ